MSSPKKKTRPEYPSMGEFLGEAVPHLIRGPLYAAVFTCYVIRPYLFPQLVEWFRTLDLSDLPLKEQAASYFEGPGAPATHTTYRDGMFFLFLVLAVHESFYWGLNTIFLLIGKFGLFSQYKIERTARMIPSTKLVIKTLVEGAINHFVFQPFSLFFVFVYITKFPSVFREGASPVLNEMPFLETFWHFFWCQVFNELFFYIVHRAVHHPLLYKAIHKKHHEYVGSIGFAAEYASPLEQIFANQAPTIFYAMLWRSDVVGLELAFFWISWRLVETYEAHSGYCFAGSFLHKLGFTNSHQALHHDWHHSDNNGNFGVNWLDYPLGTMDTWAAKILKDKQNKEKAKQK